MPKRVALFVAILLCSPCAAAQAKPNLATEEKTLRAEAAAWFAAGAAKDAVKFSSYYAADAMLLPPNAPVVTGKDKITAYWVNFMKTPGLGVAGGPVKIVVAQSGEMAWEYGTFRLTTNDATGKPVTHNGKYVVVWKKQADGKWKAIADAFNTDK
jgi:uncharacterized protein (TIGR02246 family)